MKHDALPDLTVICLGDISLTPDAPSVVGGMGPGVAASRIASALDGADLVLANLETPITGRSVPREDKAYQLRCGEEVLDLFDARFAFNLANNHILDFGAEGLADTVQALESRGLRHVGAGCNLAAARRPAIVPVAGGTVGILGAADPRFQPATDSAAGTFPAEPARLRAAVRELRGSVDRVLVSIHAGIEFVSAPSVAQLWLADACLAEGADVVSFHHSHCLSGYLEEGAGVVFFGTGKYIVSHDMPALFRRRRESAAWRVTWHAGEVAPPRVHVGSVRIGSDGFPEPPQPRQARRALARIESCSARIARRRMRWWRLREVVAPSHVLINVARYGSMARRRGLRAMLRTLREGFRAQFRAPAD